MRVPVTIAARVAACCVAALTFTACGAGQITQTDHQVSAVDGASGDVGDTIALRNVVIPAPHNATGTYPTGSTVPVLLAIVNQGNSADELVGVTSPAASQVQVEGTTQVPPGTTILGTAGSAPSEGGLSSPLVAGQLRVLLTSTEPLRAGQNTLLTFQFRNAGKLTLPVPMAALSTTAS